MLKFDIKRKINTLRDILVGKVPDPKAQVEQITIAMIYKFMDDIDLDGMEFGLSGAREFFKDDFEKYAWSNIMQSENSGQQRAILYAEGIDKMAMNPHLPQLFRDIFRGAYVPYRDPDTLNMFLKEISEFSYNNSEDLGNAFEYLLSIMGSQGDAGQFRTPRHIIDMIVEIVDPKKNETVLDPACGTAGFLISAYKHILEYNKDENGKITLTADDRKRLTANFAGYDISPDMVRLSRVNMYLHKFTKPQISEYDTLTSEEKWDDSFDVILANPPFMTPKGGIIPHNRYRVAAKRAEVLFVDYIAEHLNPTGRAGVIVPEGIVFQSANAYKQLREYLVKDNLLYAVISLPAGVFNPYSGVKTSVLLFDKTLAKQRDEILFVKMTNDGYDLGAQRREIKQNDISDIVGIVHAFQDGADVSCYPQYATLASKEEIAKNDYILVGERYKEVAVVNSQWPLVELGEVCEIIAGQSPEGEFYNDNAEGLPFYQGKTEFTNMYLGKPKKWTTKVTKTGQANDIVMSVRAPVGPVNIVSEEICIGRGLAAIRPRNQTMPMYVFTILDQMQDRINGNNGAAFSSINKKEIEQIKIPLPPLSVQAEIVAEIESYQKIIDGARQVVDNYKPAIKVDPSWEMVKLGDICSITSGGTPDRSNPDYWNGNIPYVKTGLISFNSIDQSDEFITENGLTNSSTKVINKGAILMAMYGQGITRGRVALLNIDAAINQAVAAININSPLEIIREYLYLYLQSQYEYLREISSARGGNQSNLNAQMIKELQVSLPPFDVQHQIVENINEEMAIVEQNKRLIEIFEQKIKDKISGVWGE